LLDAWAEAGVNRLSMGAQSFDGEELALLGRLHAVERPAWAVTLARRHGFRRLSVDLMFGFPGHDREHWRRTIDCALALDLEHLSAYCFIPEPGTALGDAVNLDPLTCPAEEEQAEMYAELSERLDRAGYACYETSNFCRPDAEARHNLVYWLRRPYLGIGPSAHGLIGARRYGNHYGLAAWAAALERGEPPEAHGEIETEATVAREIMMLGLRLGSGIEPADYSWPSWERVMKRYRQAFAHALATGRLERSERGWRIPERFRFVADEIIAWIEAFAERPRRTSVDSRAQAFLPSSSCPSPHFQVI
jgi:oxygen-independent coproporphyrinogen-3 oxidase